MMMMAREKKKKDFGKRVDEYLKSISVHKQFITNVNNRKKTLLSKHEEVFTRSNYFSTLLCYALHSLVLRSIVVSS